MASLEGTMAEKNIIGRKEDLETLKDLRNAKTANFVAVYGRRRIGKTFLIREYFCDKGIFLEVTGVKKLAASKQLANFSRALSKAFLNNLQLQSPVSWHDAFELLTQQIKAVRRDKKVIIFLDELPWLASKKSDLLPALDYYWNREWSRIPNLILIVCGSAASWMLDHIVNAKGGLHKRVTKHIALGPFNLRETEEFLKKSQKINLKRKQIIDLYMATGGIPFYLKEAKKGYSASQIIDSLCFQKNGILLNEFENIFRALFDKADVNIDIIRAIAKSGNLISREELIKELKIQSGSGLNRRLKELEASHFIQCFVPLGKKVRDRFYRITDEYSLFYLKWLDPLLRSGTFKGQNGYWQKINNTPAKSTWAGYAFESICFKHIEHIRRALEIQGHYQSGSWKYASRKRGDKGAQIDLLFDRDDGTITLCEIKYCDKHFTIEKAYAQALDKKKEVFSMNYPSSRQPTGKQIFLAMLTPLGVKKNMYSEDLVHNEVTLDDLFKGR